MECCCKEFGGEEVDELEELDDGRWVVVAVAELAVGVEATTTPPVLVVLLRNWCTIAGSRSGGLCCDDCRIIRSISSMVLSRSSIDSNAALLKWLRLSSPWCCVADG